jgi:hypothetical protein
VDGRRIKKHRGNIQKYVLYNYSFTLSTIRQEERRLHNKMLWNQSMFAGIQIAKKEFFYPKGIYQFKL